GSEYLGAGLVSGEEVGLLQGGPVHGDFSAGVAADHGISGKPDDPFNISRVASGEAEPLGGRGDGIQHGTLSAVQRGKGSPAVKDDDVAPADRLIVEVRPGYQDAVAVFKDGFHGVGGDEID